MKEQEQIIWQYLEGLLSESETRLFEERLSKDEGLRKNLAEIKAIHKQLLQLEPMSAPEGMAENIMSHISNEEILVISKPPRSTDSLGKLGKCLVLFGAISCIGGLVFSLMYPIQNETFGWTDPVTIYLVKSVTNLFDFTNSLSTFSVDPRANLFMVAALAMMMVYWADKLWLYKRTKQAR